MIIARETYKGIPVIYIDASPERPSYRPTSERLDYLYGGISPPCSSHNMDLLMARGREHTEGARYAFL